MIRHRRQSPLAGLAHLAVATFLTAGAPGLTRFDFNDPGSETQVGWVAAELGNGSDGTISVVTSTLGNVSMASRNRAGSSSDAGGGSEAAMWNDFIFASGSYSPGQGLQITISGLLPETFYPLKLWAFDDASNAQLDGFARAADWSSADGAGGRLSFPDAPDPETLDDYHLGFIARSDMEGVIILSGSATSVDPSSSHNVFVNGLEIGEPLFDADADGLSDSFEHAIIDFDPDDDIETLEDVSPVGDFDSDGSSNASENDRGTDPTDPDSDDDGLRDGVESNDGTWSGAGMTGTDPLLPDSDGDGLLDGVENPDLPFDSNNGTAQPGSDPNVADSDGDSIGDGSEIAEGSDPTDPLSFFDPYADAVAKFDFNDLGGSPTQGAWTAAVGGVGSDGMISVTTEAVGDASSLSSRDRPENNTDTGDVDHNDLWRDFVFANGSGGNNPGSGLRLTLSGLAPSTTYPVTVWAFDSASVSGRAADWGTAGAPTTTLTFQAQTDPASLDDYQVTFETRSDESGRLVIEGLVSSSLPHPSSNNVFINALAIGRAIPTSRIRITDFDFQPGGENSSITWTSVPGSTYAIDLTTDLKGWPADLEDRVEAASDAGETTFQFDSRGLGPRAYIRVREISGG